MTKRHRFPSTHLRCTEREWRQKKRQEWKLLVNALNTFQWGAAYTPVHADLHDLEKLARRILEDLEGDWIAW
jgi:hypothetical protein